MFVHAAAVPGGGAAEAAGRRGAGPVVGDGALPGTAEIRGGKRQGRTPPSCNPGSTRIVPGDMSHLLSGGKKNSCYSSLAVLRTSRRWSQSNADML